MVHALIAALMASLLAAAALYPDAARTDASTTTIKNWTVPRLAVMPLGDSITYGTGSSTGSGYRGELWKRLTPHTGNLHFVGSQRSGKLSDPAHEGHYGWKIGGLVDNIDKWLIAAKSNAVLVHIGTNDMHDNYRADQAPGRLGELIDKITTAAPNMTVLVSSLVPSTDAGTEKRIEKYNAAVPRVVKKRRGRGFQVGFVDMGKVTTHDLRDVLHPNDSGYSKMAAAFYDGIARSAEDGWIKERVGIKPVPSARHPLATAFGPRH
ncbi:SGNH/GDSL hydrolase family protein [Streptomyces orinoci]|uniref:SGNH/GDSL hydrolase family protein n=1 Tax=Streptomyces orinoci TaxID=67339 RepID=A0ABV3K055_STRON|nr:SGNH/GDSL hydrolase family protein [Streptomyces orinoci]